MRSIGIKYGLICGLVYIIIGLLSIVLGLNDGSASSGMIGIALAIVIVGATFYVIYIGAKDYRDNVNGGGLSLGDGVKLGVFIAFIAGIMAALFNLLYYNVIDPDFMETSMELAREAMEDRDMTDEQIEMAQKITKIFQSPAVTILYTTFWGLLKGLIAGAILKRDKPMVAEV